MDYKHSFEEVKKSLIDLIEKNKIIPIIVEGEKDIDALRKIGVTGEIIGINSGKSLIDFCDKIAMQHKKIIILTDWDRKGGFLCSRIKRNLEGRVDCDTHFREKFSKYSMIKTVEGLPSWIDTMKNKISLNGKAIN